MVGHWNSLDRGPASVVSEVESRDIVPKLADNAEDIPNHVCECGIVREKLFKTEAHQNVPSFNHGTSGCLVLLFC